MTSLIVFLPLFSSFCSGFFGFKIGTKGVALVTAISLILSFICSILTFLTIGLKLTPVYVTLLD
jgi:hypothetical protein